MVIIKAIYRQYRHKDFSYLLNSSKTSKAASDDDISQTSFVYIPPKERPIDCADIEEIFLNNSRAEHKISKADKLSNPLYKYAYSNVTNVYHDKECPWAKKIPDEEFETTMHFSNEYNWCPECYKAAVIRYGMQGDSKLFDRYLEFFRSVKADKNLLTFLIIENKAKLWIVSATTMEFKVNEDKWRVSIRNGILTLLHNNYYVDKFGKRVFERSFHVQLENMQNFRVCINHMVSYSWKEHLAQQDKKQQLEQEREHYKDVLAEFSNNGFIENFLYIKNRYWFSDKYIYLDSDDYIADRFFTKYNVKTKILDEYIVPNSKCRWIICKIPKKQISKFSLAMRKTSRAMFWRKDYGYYDILKTFIDIK